MQPEIFIDVLVFENFIMDFFILYMTAKLLYMGTGIRPKKWLLRMGISSSIGVIYTVCSVLLFTSALSLFVFKIMLSLGMVYVAFYPRTFRQLTKALGCFYGVTLLTGGASLCVLAWNWPVNYIFPAVMIVWIVGDVTVKVIRQKRHLAKCGADLYVQFEAQGMWLPALLDSGNELKDPCSGKAVVVVELGALKEILPDTIYAFLQQETPDRLLEAQHLFAVHPWAHRMRLIPFSSLGCEDGLLVGFRADLIRVRPNGGDVITLYDQIVCLCRKTLTGDGRYRALLGAVLLVENESEQTQTVVSA